MVGAHGIVEFFDGTYIDLGRIIEISPVVISPDRSVSFQITYMFQEKPRVFRWDMYSVLTPAERQESTKAIVMSDPKNIAKAQDEVARLGQSDIAGHRAALVEAWKTYRAAYSPLDVARVSADMTEVKA